MVGGDQVAKGKPDPETYLRVADALGSKPAVCTAVEDSANGVAGMRCLVVPNPITSHEDLSDADIIASDLREAVKLIRVGE